MWRARRGEPGVARADPRAAPPSVPGRERRASQWCQDPGRPASRPASRMFVMAYGNLFLSANGGQPVHLEGGAGRAGRVPVLQVSLFQACFLMHLV